MQGEEGGGGCKDTGMSSVYVEPNRFLKCNIINELLTHIPFILPLYGWIQKPKIKNCKIR